jgi:hypothetical protein
VNDPNDPDASLEDLIDRRLAVQQKAMLMRVLKWAIGLALTIAFLYLTFRNSTDICAESTTTQQEYEDCVDHYSEYDPNT